MTNSIACRCRAIICGALAAIAVSQVIPMYAEHIDAETDLMLRNEVFNKPPLQTSVSNIELEPASLRCRELYVGMAEKLELLIDTDSDIFANAISVTSIPNDIWEMTQVGCSTHGEGFRLLDVPLTEEQQRYVWSIANEFGIDPIMIYGIMNAETRYKIGINSKNGKYIGIMQIAKSGLKNLKKRVGVTDLTDFEQNVRAGAYFISYYHKKYGCDINKILMCYHCGGGGANARWRNGITEDGYCRRVRAEMNRILTAGEVFAD